ncbi:hypothetical protein EUGRSUZ_F02517 [Eucalyptus grandis]|uniref:Uncharacterized protein n=1 Tax=Eucalyptus grandis TaxID=71139 RepID=A0ACC3KI84_EUCGR|nr:hypothetical protein EUGRSUZ_F02517 [Eucalyptus grandis]
MHPRRHPFWDLSLCILITTALSLIRAPTTHGADDASYLSCNSTIQCGILQNASYPFWGSNRPSYCGLPNFELTCQDNTTPLLNISNQIFRPLIPIPPSSSFSYTSDTVASNLTLYYGCEASTSQIVSTIIKSQFNCTINNNNDTGYFITKKVSDIPYADPTTIATYFGGCTTSVVLPAYQSAIQEIESNPTSATVESAIDEGFGLQWTVDNQCTLCLASGGQCGRDNSSGDFTCYCKDKSYSSTCSAAAPLVNVSYPFTGGDRPAHCGPPEFRLGCVADSPQLTAGSLTYRVLALDQVRRSLTLSRTDLYNNTCLQQYDNTTLNSTIFTLASDNEDLTLFYECSTLMTVKPENLFTCEVSGTATNNYYLIGAVPVDPILSVSKCNVSVTVPILQSAVIMLTANRSRLGDALMEGFEVNYTNPYEDQCGKCVGIGGECGFDSDHGKPVCICGDQICSTAENYAAIDSSQFNAAGSQDKVSLKVGLFLAGAAIAGLLLGFWIFSYIQKRKRKRAAAAEAQSKSITPPPSSKGLPISSSNFSRTTPSYPTSKSDLDRGSTYFGVQVFNYTELEEATQNFDPSRELGEGGFGTVYYGRLQDGREVAVKRLFENNLKRVEQFMNEVEILTRLRHPNLVTLFGCTSRRSRELLLVYEYIPNGTMADHLFGKSSSTGPIPWRIRLNMAIESADALAYLHKSDVIHRDVKTNNILLDHSFRVKVADFGLSRLFPTDVTHVSTAPQGTPGYVDPEYYQCYQLTDKSDVYSFGVVLCELISSKPAVDTNRHRHDINLASMAVNKIQNHSLHELVDPALGRRET